MKCRDVDSGEGTASGTSSSLLARARANDPDAWVQLVQTYSRRIYRWCRRSGFQPADASNVVQEVLRVVASRLSDFRHDRDSDTFRGWIYRITQNKLRDYVRAERRRAERPAGGTDAYRQLLNCRDPSSGSSSQPMPSSWMRLPADQRDAIERVRAEVSTRDWCFFWRVVVDGQTAGEVAHEFGVTANTVRLVKMRLLRRLREALGAVKK